MEERKTTDKKDSQKQPAKADAELQKSTETQAKADVELQKLTETHRYRLAMLFIGAFLFIMVVAVWGTIFWGYTGIANLVGYFTGWIAAIIGFYFLQQNTAGAQAQAKDATNRGAADAAYARDVEGKNRMLSGVGLDIAEAQVLLSQLQKPAGRPEKGLRAEEGPSPDLISLAREVEEKLRRAQERIKSYSIG